MNQQQQPVNYETWNHHCKYIKPLLRCVVLIYGFYYIYIVTNFLSRGHTRYHSTVPGTRYRNRPFLVIPVPVPGTWFLVPLSDILVVFLFYTPHFINFIFRELNCFYYIEYSYYLVLPPTKNKATNKYCFFLSCPWSWRNRDVHSHEQNHNPGYEEHAWKTEIGSPVHAPILLRFCRVLGFCSVRGCR